MKVWLVRHGETEFNTGAPRFRGTYEIGLSDAGKAQAKAVGEGLAKEVKFDVIYYSRLSRAKETAQAIKSHQPSARFEEEDLLYDMSFGEWQGQLVTDVFPTEEEMLRWRQRPTSIAIPGGDSFYGIISQIHNLFLKLRASTSTNVCLVTHRALIHLILCYLLKIDPDHFWDFECWTGSISRFDLLPNNRFKLINFNDTRYVHHLLTHLT